MNTKNPTPLVEETRAQALDAINAGVSDGEQHEQTLASEAVARAAVIIANIPSLIREATKEGLRKKLRSPLFRTELMPIDIDDTSEYLHTRATDVISGTFVSEENLTHAARIVFDHCQKAGLHVFVSRNKPDGQIYVTYSLDISWSLPGTNQSAKPRRKLWLAWRK